MFDFLFSPANFRNYLYMRTKEKHTKEARQQAFADLRREKEKETSHPPLFCHYTTLLKTEHIMRDFNREN